MKKHLLCISILLLFALASQAQWQTDVQLSNDPTASGTSLNNAWCVAASGDSVHAVWDDERNGNPELYYKGSVDGGLTWGAETRLTDNADASYDPCIALSGSDVHVVWQNEFAGYYAVYYKRSTDGGQTWGADTSLTNVPADLWNPSIAVNGSTLHVVWEDERQGNSEIYYKTSTDGGAHWGADTRLTNNSADSWNPSVSVSGSLVHVVWYDFRNGNWEIYYKRSADGGLSWGTEDRLTNHPGVSRYPSVAVSGSVVHVVWHDDRGGNLQPYYKRSADGGLSWEADMPLSTNLSGGYYPCIAVSGSFAHVVWYDFRDGNYEIYYKVSGDEGTNWGPDTRLTNEAAYSFSPSIAVSGPALHVVWQDYRDGNYEVYYKGNPTGNTVGIADLPSDEDAIRVFPNPFSNEITISTGLNESCEIILYDMTSRVVLKERFTGTINLNTAQLGKGIYILELRNNTEILQKAKMVKD